MESLSLLSQHLLSSFLFFLVILSLGICFLSCSDLFSSINSEYIWRMNGHKSNWAFDFKPFLTKCEIIAIRLPVEGIWVGSLFFFFMRKWNHWNYQGGLTSRITISASWLQWVDLTWLYLLEICPENLSLAAEFWPQKSQMVLGRIGTTSSPYGAVYKILKVILPQVFLFVSVRNHGNLCILLNKPLLPSARKLLQ